jgi:hypothetical protein
MYVTCGDFHDGSEKGTASVHQILCQSWEKCYRDPHNDLTSLWGLNLESYAGVSMGTTSGVMVANRPYGGFYDFYSVSPEYFGYTLVHLISPQNFSF